MKNNIYIIAIFVTLTIIGCEDKSDLNAPENPSTGNADFTKFVSIGNSLTAGYQSGALYETSQNYSYGKIIADQVGAEYIQPTISDPGIGGRIEAASISPFLTAIQPEDAGTPTNLDYAGTYNNLGIPGIVLADLLTTDSNPSPYIGDNPFIDIVLRGQGTVISQALALQPTFMTVWIGNNDILGYATSGGLLPYTPTEGTNNFGEIYSQLLGAISHAGVTNVVVANIPDVSSIPFFTTVGSQLMLNGVTVVFGTKSDNTVAPMDLTKNLLTLKASEEIAAGKGLSTINPLSNSVILDEDEIVIAKNVIASYNSTIISTAQQYGYKVADMNAFFNYVAQNGIVEDGVELSAIYVSGGLFSLDGVHPSSQGYALIANKFIEVINSEYSANIPRINVSTIPGSLELAKRIKYNELSLPIFESDTFNSIFY